MVQHYGIGIEATAKALSSFGVGLRKATEQVRRFARDYIRRGGWQKPQKQPEAKPFKRYFNEVTIHTLDEWESLLGKPDTITEVLWLNIYAIFPGDAYCNGRGGPLVLTGSDNRKIIIRGSSKWEVPHETTTPEEVMHKALTEKGEQEFKREMLNTPIERTEDHGEK